MSGPLVLKLGGRVLEDLDSGSPLCREVAALAAAGAPLCIVHGGGRQASDLGRRLGCEPVILEGRRVTDAAALRAVVMALAGEINTQLVAALGAHGLRAVGLTGVDAGMILAGRRPPRDVVDPLTGSSRLVDYGLVGDISSVDPRPARTLMDAGMIPVVACLASDGRGGILNVNADTIAAALAGALEAETLVLASDVEGILTAQGVRIPSADACAVREMIGRGVITGGMAIKAQAGLEALARGVSRVLIVNGLGPSSLRRAVDLTATGTELRA